MWTVSLPWHCVSSPPWRTLGQAPDRLLVRGLSLDGPYARDVTLDEAFGQAVSVHV